jgi:uncharacterized protein YcfJ
MNRIMTTAIVTVLAGGVAVGAYKSGLVTPYADVVSSTPVTIKEPVYGDVLASTAVSQTVNSSEQVCENKTVQKRAPERFGTKDGTIIGAVVGGLIGSQFGGGSGRALATAGGAVAGGFAGHEIDEHHHGGRLYTSSERVCRNEPTSQEKIIGYDVRYRTEDGQVLTRREDSDPGMRLWLGDKDVIVGYDVNWRYKDQTGTIRMDEKPGDRLPMSNGAIVVANKENSPAKG